MSKTTFTICKFLVMAGFIKIMSTNACYHKWNEISKIIYVFLRVKLFLGSRCNIWIYNEIKMAQLKHQGQKSLE